MLTIRRSEEDHAARTPKSSASNIFNLCAHNRSQKCVNCTLHAATSSRYVTFTRIMSSSLALQLVEQLSQLVHFVYRPVLLFIAFINIYISSPFATNNCYFTLQTIVIIQSAAFISDKTLWSGFCNCVWTVCSFLSDMSLLLLLLDSVWQFSSFSLFFCISWPFFCSRTTKCP